MADESDRSLCIGYGGPLSLSNLARLDLDTATFKVFYEARERFDLNTREHLLARITPGELQFIEHVCLHPERTEEEVIATLGLRENTVLAYYAHLGRNFNVRTISELRRWANEHHLVSMPDDRPVDGKPVDQPGEPPEKSFDPWVRWY